MSARNVLQTTFDDFAKAAGFTKKSGTWCRRQQDTIAVLELQKSQYGAQYFVNVALWLLELGDAQCPREQACHLRSRLTRLLPEDEDRLKAALDLDDSSLVEIERREAFLEALEERLLRLLDSCSTLEGVRSLEATGLLSSFLIAGSAQRLLERSEA